MAHPSKGQPVQLEPLLVALSLDPEAFDAFIADHGVQLVHWRGMRCPIGLTDPDDARRPHPHHEGCSNGFLYTPAGTMTCGFLGNSKQSNFEEIGRVDDATVQCVLPRFYDQQGDGCDPKRIEICQFDRLYLKDEDQHEPITVVNWQLVQAHETGTDRLQFPAVTVTDLVDSRGERYAPGVDFAIVRGAIVWTGSRRPGFDSKTQKGTVYSVRYTYRPYWYVQRMEHEVRVAQVEDDYGNRSLNRMPQLALLKREFLFQKEQNDPQAPPSARQEPAAPSGVFGPR